MLRVGSFTHPSYSDKLYIYNSREIQDGDLLWESPAYEKYARMNDNLDSLIYLSVQKGINLVILIATDKYDAYSPWIKEEDTHEKVDIKELNARIAEIVAREAVLRAEIDKIIAEIEGEDA